MGSILFVVWRECLEGLLVVGIFHTWLRREQQPTRAIWLGVGGGIGLAGLLGAMLLYLQGELAGQALEAFQAAILLAASALVTQMVLWMRRHGRSLKASLEQEASRAAERSGTLGIALVIALAIAREGAELVVFLYGLSFEAGSVANLALGTVGGFAAAMFTAWLASKGLSRLKLPLLLRFSAILLLLFAGALLVAGVDRLVGQGWLPGVVDPLWSSAWLLEDSAGLGRVVADVAGYRAQPSLTTLFAFCAYWLYVRWTLKRI